MNDKLKKLLFLVGVSKDVVAAFESGDEDKIKAIDLEEVEETHEENIKTRLRNNKAFMSEVEESIRGKVLNSKQKRLQKMFDLSDDEIEALPKETRFDSMLELVAKKAGETKSKEGQNEEYLKAMKENKELKTKIKKLEEEEIPSIKDSVQKEKDRFHLENYADSILGKAELLVDVHFARKGILSEIEDEVDIRKDEKGRFILKQKNSDLDVLDESKTKPISFDDLLLKKVEEKKLVKKSNGSSGQPNPVATGRTINGSTEKAEHQWPGMEREI